MTLEDPAGSPLIRFCRLCRLGKEKSCQPGAVLTYACLCLMDASTPTLRSVPVVNLRPSVVPKRDLWPKDRPFCSNWHADVDYNEARVVPLLWKSPASVSWLGERQLTGCIFSTSKIHNGGAAATKRQDWRRRDSKFRICYIFSELSGAGGKMRRAEKQNRRETNAERKSLSPLYVCPAASGFPNNLRFGCGKRHGRAVGKISK